jgi:hypothetical protein
MLRRARQDRRRLAEHMPHPMVRGFAGMVKLAGWVPALGAPQKARYCSVTWGLRT